MGKRKINLFMKAIDMIHIANTKQQYTNDKLSRNQEIILTIIKQLYILVPIKK